MPIIDYDHRSDKRGGVGRSVHFVLLCALVLFAFAGGVWVAVDFRILRLLLVIVTCIAGGVVLAITFPRSR